MEKIVVNNFTVEIVDNKLVIEDLTDEDINIVTFLNKLEEATEEQVNLYFGDLWVLFRLSRNKKENVALMIIKGNGEILIGDDVYDERLSIANYDNYSDLIDLVDSGKLVYLQNGKIVYVTYEDGSIIEKYLNNDGDYHYSFAKRRILRSDIKDVFDSCGIEFDKDHNNYNKLTLYNIYEFALKYPYANYNYMETIFKFKDCKKFLDMRIAIKSLYTFVTKLYVEYEKYGQTPYFIKQLRSELCKNGLKNLSKHLDYDLNKTLKNITLEDVKCFLNVDNNPNFMNKITNGVLDE